MTSSFFMLGLIAEYGVIAIVAACEQNWPRVFYWCGASIITGSWSWTLKT